MRRTRAIAALAAVVSLAAGAVTFTAQAKPAKGASHERGKYLVTIMGCGDCHTPGTFYGAPDGNRMLAGSELGWVGPWGVVYAGNLTPHATGLGNWTEAQIVQALRTGNRPDGRQLAPIMPWLNFAALTDDDAHAIAAYLKRLPPVEHRTPAPVPPGQPVQGPTLSFPPPGPWDAPRTPPAGGQ
jgi:mono/diheme cytochrome c family protein